jgi:type IV secretion system protein VirB6
VKVIDKVWFDGNLVAEQLLRKGSVLSGDFAYYLAGFGVYLIVGATVVYVAFLLALSKVAVALILALGPLFIGLLFFSATRRFFESWVAQLANYALITVLALFASSFMLTVVSAYGKNAVALGSSVTIAESVRVCIASALVLLVLRQVPALAAGLASGVALSSFNAVSGLLNWGLGTTKRTGYELTRGAIDGWRGEPVSRWDTLRRGAGNLVGSGLGHVRDQLSTPTSGGKLIPRERVYPPPSHLRR